MTSTPEDVRVTRTRELINHLRAHDDVVVFERFNPPDSRQVDSWPCDGVPLRNLLQLALAARLSNASSGPVLLAAIERFVEVTLQELSKELK